MATATSSLTVFLLSMAFFFFYLSAVVAAGGNGGFTVNLIHRDSPHSPHHNPSDTLSHRLIRAVHRSNSRRDFFASSSSKTNPNIRSRVIPNGGEYLMSLSIGTPPAQILAIADTGSDLIWIQCQPCHGCYQQENALFDPQTSSTYRNMSCESSPCRALPISSCGVSGSCEYLYGYGDRSYTQGALAMETLTFDATGGSSIHIPKVVVGCGHNDSGSFDRRGEGLVGLGMGRLSLSRQLGSSINGKFSYCLVPLQDNSTSTLNFGNTASIFSGESVVSMPLVSKSPEDTFYWVTLEKITVGTESVDLPAEEGNIIVDSGTTLTFLESSVYNKLSAAISKTIQLPVADDPNGYMSNCYNITGTTDDGEMPEVIFGFAGAELRLSSLNTFILVSDDVVCLAIIPSQDISILGNIAQQNFMVGYDLVGKRLSFAPTDCSKL